MNVYGNVIQMYQSKPWSPVSTQILWICLFIHFRISAGYRCLVILSQKIQHFHDNLWVDVSHIFVFIGISSNVKQPDVLFWRFTVIFHLMQRLHVRWWNPATISWRKYTILTIKSSSYLCMYQNIAFVNNQIYYCVIKSERSAEEIWQVLLPGLPVISFQSPKRTAARILLSNGLFGSLCPTGWNNGSMLCRIELLWLTADPSLQTIYDSITEDPITSFIKYAPLFSWNQNWANIFFNCKSRMHHNNLHFSDKRWHIIIGIGLRKLFYYM